MLTILEEDQEGADSALDLLAQASQLEVAQGETPPAEPIQFPTPTQTQQSTRPPSSTGSFLEPPIDLHPTPPSHSHSQSQSQGQDQNESGLVLSTEPTTMKTPSTRPRNLSISQLSELQTPRGNYEVQHPGHATDPPAHMQYQSPQGNGGVPGLGKYVHLSSSMPARRVRSPYLKWTIEEVSPSCSSLIISFPSFETHWSLLDKEFSGRELDGNWSGNVSNGADK